MKKSVVRPFRFLIVSTIICVLLILMACGKINIVSVNGISMYPTLKNRDFLVVLNNNYTPEQGNVVVIQVPSGTSPTEYIIKRIIAVGGQDVTIDYRNNLVFVNDQQLSEQYINFDCSDVMISSDENQCIQYHVPDNCIFVLGDNRNYSVDSRNVDYGMLSSEMIVGKVVFRLSLTDFDISVVK